MFQWSILYNSASAAISMIFRLHSATWWSVCVLHEKYTGRDFHQVQGSACTGAEGPEAQRGGSGDENSCLLWLVAASARSGKSVEQEPSCESPRGNKSFLTSPLTHHTAGQNKACVSALLLSVNVHICAGSSSVCECRCVYAAGSMFYSTPWNNVPLLRMGYITLYE